MTIVVRESTRKEENEHGYWNFEQATAIIIQLPRDHTIPVEEGREGRAAERHDL